MMSDECVILHWPECQELMELDGWEDHAHLILDDKGVAKCGKHAYMVEKLWLDSINDPYDALQN